jgi:hypothetical protein
MPDFNKDQFYEVLRQGGYENPETPEYLSDEFLEQVVECDNCGRDVHMDDAFYVPNDEKIGRGYSNFYCSEECQEEHQSGPWAGSIGSKKGITELLGGLFNNENPQDPEDPQDDKD